ncbi:MAG: (2Fe-2S) ferredoxin domain-containing protein [Epulopiscium sp.]|nr:(2Fe-2S) ferredoxin domain-containing protein [Candidatus Epulonipiscium sp.]
MTITICIGSSCHLKGSRQVVEELQYLISQNDLKDKIDLKGTFCMNNCQNGVCVTVDDTPYSLTPENTNEFFENEVLKRI